MAPKDKGRAGGDRATQETSDSCNSTPIASRAKVLIVQAPLWGLLSPGLEGA
jgi:hypothetical protein